MWRMPILVALVLGSGALPSARQAPELRAAPALDLLLVRWEPGPRALTLGPGVEDPFSPDELQELRRRGYAGRIADVKRVASRSPDGVERRLVILLRRQLTDTARPVRLPLPGQGRRVYVQQPEGADGWITWPLEAGRVELFVYLCVNADDPHQMDFSVDGEAGREAYAALYRW
jgi:hypothetical protein